jgi:hypothetical protein
MLMEPIALKRWSLSIHSPHARPARAPPSAAAMITAVVMEHVEAILTQLQPYAELVTPLHFDYFNAQVDTLSATLGIASDQVRYVLCLFAAYPLAVFYKLLPSASLKHVFDIAVGISLAQFVLGSGWVHSFISSFITYLLVKFGPPKYAPYIVFLFNMVRRVSLLDTGILLETHGIVLQ